MITGSFTPCADCTRGDLIAAQVQSIQQNFESARVLLRQAIDVLEQIRTDAGEELAETCGLLIKRLEPIAAPVQAARPKADPAEMAEALLSETRS
jgi:hypothetical protein